MLAERNANLPDWIDEDAWSGWEELRKKMKKPLTPRARQLAINRLAEFRAAGHDPNAILDESTLNGWQGLFAPKTKPQPVESSSAWAEFRACIRDNRMPGDPALQSIIRTFGGLNRLGELSSWDIENRLRKDFDAGYRLAKAH